MNALTKPGPFGLPVYAWLAGVGALGLALIVFLRSRKAGTSASTATMGNPNTPSQYPSVQYVPYPYPVQSSQAPTGTTGPITVPPAGVQYPPVHPPHIQPPQPPHFGDGGRPLPAQPAQGFASGFAPGGELGTVAPAPINTQASGMFGQQVYNGKLA